MNAKIDWKKYVIVFAITLLLFVTALYLSNLFTQKKIDNIKSIQDKISIDILSTETQFSLLDEDLSCKDVDESVLTQELNSLAEKITYSEEHITDEDSVTSLKKYYSLLEIKDYLLLKKISERCGFTSHFILYFYTTSENCSECIKQGFALTSLREKYSKLRVYSFDYGLDLSAIRALISIYKIEDTKLPALIIDGKLYTGFKTIEDVEAILPDLPEALAAEATQALDATSSTALPESEAVNTK